MKFLILLAIAFALHAEDAAPLATVEQLKKQVAEQKEQIAKLQEQVPYLQRKLQMYQQGLFACQDAQIDAQAKVVKQEKSSK